MEVLFQKSTCACVYLQSTSVSHCRQQSLVSCLRSSAGLLPTSRTLPSIDVHKFAGSSGPMPGNTAPIYSRRRNLFTCAAGNTESLNECGLQSFPFVTVRPWKMTLRDRLCTLQAISLIHSTWTTTMSKTSLRHIPLRSDDWTLSSISQAMYPIMQPHFTSVKGQESANIWK